MWDGPRAGIEGAKERFGAHEPVEEAVAPLEQLGQLRVEVLDEERLVRAEPLLRALVLDPHRARGPVAAPLGGSEQL